MFILKCRGRNILSIYREFLRLEILESAQELRAKSCCYAIWLLGMGGVEECWQENQTACEELGRAKQWGRENVQGRYPLVYVTYILVSAWQTIAAIGLIGAGCKGSRSVGERMAQVPPSTQLYISLQRHGGLLVTMEKQNYLCDFTLFWTTSEIPVRLFKANSHR